MTRNKFYKSTFHQLQVIKVHVWHVSLTRKIFSLCFPVLMFSTVWLFLLRSKTSRKFKPTKMTSDIIKEFYSFVLSKRKRKEKKLRRNLTNIDEAMDTAMDQSTETSAATTISSTGITATSQMHGPALMNIDSQGNPVQMPLITPHVLQLPGGGQPALVFFVGSPGMPAMGELPGLTNVSSSTPFGNAVLFSTQPVTLNVVPQDSASTAGVIEKAMELAQCQTNPVNNDNQQLSPNATEMVTSGNSFIPPNAGCNLQSGLSQGTLPVDHSVSALPQVSQNVVIAQSVAAGENVPIDNVSQSVTVQTSQIMQNQGFADFRSFLEEARAGIAGTGIVSAEANQDATGPKLIYKRKGLTIREVMTQTGADPEIFVVSERKLDCEEDSPVEEPPENSGTNRTVKKPGLFDAL